jgi:hypothetical protein
MESDDGQTLAEERAVELVAWGRRDSAIDAYLVQGPVRGRNARCAYSEHPVTSAQEVYLDQIDLAIPELPLLSTVEILPFPR